MAARLAGYRKFFGLVLICSLATLAKGLGFLDETLATFLGAAYLTYVGGNVGEHWTRSKSPFPPLPHLIPRRGAEQTTPAPARRAPARARDPELDQAFDMAEVTDAGSSVLDRLEAAGIDLDEVVRAASARRR